jgi:hypothetical protein
LRHYRIPSPRLVDPLRREPLMQSQYDENGAQVGGEVAAEVE